MNYYGGEKNILAGTGQEDRFSGHVCWDILCLIIKLIEKEKVEIQLKLVITKIEEGIIVVLFIDDTDMISEGDTAREKMQKMLEIYNRLYLATRRYIEDKKCKYFAWIWKWK